MASPRLYEKSIWVFNFVREIWLYKRNSYGFPRLYEKFKWWSGLYEKFTNHGYTAIQRVIFQVSTVSRKKKY